VNERVLTIHCSGAKDSTIQLYYIAEVAEEGKEETTVTTRLYGTKETE
jgi:hypothetical protein